MPQDVTATPTAAVALAAYEQVFIPMHVSMP